MRRKLWIVILILISIFLSIKFFAYAQPLINESISRGPYPLGERYYIRVFNVDDISRVKVNGRDVSEVGYYQEKQIDITGYLREGQNTIELILENTGGGWTYGYELKRGNAVIWQDRCGSVGREGCRNNDQTRGIVARHVINLTLQAPAQEDLKEWFLNSIANYIANPQKEKTLDGFLKDYKKYWEKLGIWEEIEGQLASNNSFKCIPYQGIPARRQCKALVNFYVYYILNTKQWLARDEEIITNGLHLKNGAGEQIIQQIVRLQRKDYESNKGLNKQALKQALLNRDIQRGDIFFIYVDPKNRWGHYGIIYDIKNGNIQVLDANRKFDGELRITSLEELLDVLNRTSWQWIEVARIKKLKFNRIAYLSPVGNGIANLWLINEDGTERTLFRKSIFCSEPGFLPAFSPDGTKIVYHHLLGEPPFESLRIPSFQEGELRIASLREPLAHDQVTFRYKVEWTWWEGIIGVGYPSFIRWSHDGRGLYFMSEGKLHKLDLVSNKIYQYKLPFGVGSITRPYDIRKQDGKIVFVRTVENDNTFISQGWLMIADKDGKNPVPFFGPITIKYPRWYWEEVMEFGVSTNIELPTWSPDGRKIAFVLKKWEGSFDYRKGDTADYLAIIDEKKKLKILWRLPKGIPLEIAWSPDGEKIAYCINEFSGEGTIYIIKADGSEPPKQLTKGYLVYYLLVH